MKKINALIILIDKYTELIKPLIDKNNNLDRKKDFELFINIAFLERFYYNLVAVNTLLELFKIDHNFKLPLGLLLRTGISDFLTFFYFKLIIKENYPNVESINNGIKKFLAVNIKYLMKEIEFYLSKEWITSPQRDDELQRIKRLYDDFFDSSTGELIKPEDKKISEITKLLEEQHDFKLMASAYEIYKIYSKYEHVGALTYDLQKIHLKNIDFDIAGIIASVVYIFLGVESIVESMSEYEDLKVYFEELNKDLSKL